MSATGSQGYQSVPEMLTDENDKSVAGKEHRRKMALAINGLVQGKSNCTFDVVVTASATSTAIVDSRISVFSVICAAMAFDANGAADIAAGIYFDTLLNGSAVMHHRSNASVRSLRLLILG